MKPLIHVDRIIGKTNTVLEKFRFPESFCMRAHLVQLSDHLRIINRNYPVQRRNTWVARPGAKYFRPINQQNSRRLLVEKQFGNLSMDLVKKKRRKKEEEQFYVCCFSGWFISKIQIWGNCNIHVSCNKTYLYNL